MPQYVLVWGGNSASTLYSSLIMNLFLTLWSVGWLGGGAFGMGKSTFIYPCCEVVQQEQYREVQLEVCVNNSPVLQSGKGQMALPENTVGLCSTGECRCSDRFEKLVAVLKGRFSSPVAQYITATICSRLGRLTTKLSLKWNNWTDFHDYTRWSFILDSRNLGY